MPISDEPVNTAFRALRKAVTSKRGRKYCLRLWSDFVRLRDARRCILCGAGGRLFAHHIIRKSLWPDLQYQTGNGITLCRKCHKEPHEGFNRRPDLSLPMDAQGGEKIDLFTGMMRALWIDALERGSLREEYYHYSDNALLRFKQFQGLAPHAPFEGPSLQRACQIWSQSPRPMVNAILNRVGVHLPEDYVQPEAPTLFQSPTHGSVLYVPYIPPAPFELGDEEDADALEEFGDDES